MKKIIIPFILFLGISLNFFAQEKSGREVRGDKYYTNYSFDKAIDRYTRVKKLSPEGQRRLAESYYILNQTNQSEAVYSCIVRSDGPVYTEDYYNYAMVLKSNGKLQESNIWMTKFAALRPMDLRASDYIAQVAELDELLKDEGNYKIIPLNINSEALDFGPSFYQNSLVFSSTRKRAKNISRKYNWTRKPFWDMYVSEKEGDKFNTPYLFDEKLTGKWHDGPASFSNKGTFMAFTRNNDKDKNKDKVIELQIQFSRKIDGEWSAPEPFILNNENYSVGQPFLTENGKTMYFTSDMPGGYGKTDIYRIKLNEKAEWGKPENLGNTINTEADELFPFYEEDRQILFFSSNGRFGLGGLDIFSCKMDNNNIGPSYNAGAPLNTRYDDFALIVDYKVNKGYFSSNRSGGSGGDDIYAVTFNSLPKDRIADPDVLFRVISPGNIPTKRRIRETFPLRNYIYFEQESTDIPERYVLLKKDQVKDFKEEQLEVFTPKELSGRSKRQMIAYYNILNILGDRMEENPSSRISLVGSSEKGPEDGKMMAESVKEYIVNIFGINASRISIEGRKKPKISSELAGGISNSALLRESDRRVSIESDSPALLMEFQSGPDAPLKPVEIVAEQEAPIDSYVSFRVEGAEEALTSWSLEIRDEKGTVQTHGPYTQESISIPGKSILSTRPEGDFKVTMLGLARNGKTIRKEASVRMTLWTPPTEEEGMRFSIIFEFSDAYAIKMYNKYLTEIVTPRIPLNGEVIVHGHTDITGSEVNNLQLSSDRANQVVSIMEKSLAEAGRADVTFKVYGFGENQEDAPFDNDSPEERAYNRTVIIDILPAR